MRAAFVLSLVLLGGAPSARDKKSGPVEMESLDGGCRFVLGTIPRIQTRHVVFEATQVVTEMKCGESAFVCGRDVRCTCAPIAADAGSR